MPWCSASLGSMGADGQQRLALSDDDDTDEDVDLW